ncbi:MAG: hypothetical protein ANABAC_0781 [Anaerolineae bacterium]|nr:MAG: hypothetical protein ANABAC_0781 [Anaerolineae bacterium]
MDCGRMTSTVHNNLRIQTTGVIVLTVICQSPAATAVW